MSEINGFTLTQLFIRNSSLTGSAYSVAIIIADRYDQRKGYSSISSRSIAKQAGVSTNTVTSALKELEESGEWRFEKGHGLTTRFYPVLDTLSTRQEKRNKTESARGAGLIKARPKKSNREPAEPTFSLDSENVKNLINEAKAKLESSSPETPDDYPDTGEDTDPHLNGLPLLPSDTGSLIEIVRPPVLTQPLSLAIRLHRRTDIKSRVNKKEFTVKHLTSLINSLSNTGAPLEVIDILLWLQCENRKPLNESFLSVVLSKCLNNGVVTKPVKWYEDKEDPAYELACDVYEIYKARHSEVTSEYAEYL